MQTNPIPAASLDHGTLNVPLAKRGDIDAQLDRYKATKAREQAAAAKVSTATMRMRRELAKGFLATLTEERLAELAAAVHVTVSALRKSLASDAHFQPSVVLALADAEAKRVAA